MYDNIYVGETSRTIYKRYYEHIQDFILVHGNALVKRNLETKDSFNFKDSKMIVKVHNNQLRNIVESSIISNHIIKQ